MKYVSSFTFLLVLLISLSCQNTPNNQIDHNHDHDHDDHHDEHAAEIKPKWSYDGTGSPSHWSELDSSYKPCDGQMQSPININVSLPHHQCVHTLKFDYTPVNAYIINKGHTIKLFYNNGSKLVFDDHEFDLIQCHFHTPSEHTLNDIHFPLEMHFVHKNEANHFLVLGVIFEEGKENHMIGEFLNMISVNRNIKEIKRDFNVAEILDDHGHFYFYNGSFTTPPCTEGVQWAISKKVLKASKSQIKSILEMEGFNSRPVQHVNNREVEED